MVVCACALGCGLVPNGVFHISREWVKSGRDATRRDATRSHVNFQLSEIKSWWYMSSSVEFDDACGLVPDGVFHTSSVAWRLFLSRSPILTFFFLIPSLPQKPRRIEGLTDCVSGGGR